MRLKGLHSDKALRGKGWGGGRGRREGGKEREGGRNGGGERERYVAQDSA